MSDFTAEIIALRPDATRMLIGSHRVIRYCDETPAHAFVSIAKVDRDNVIIELTARDSYDETLARFLLDQLECQSLPSADSGSIRVFDVPFPDPWSFECVVITPPLVANRFENESDALNAATYWVVPAFQGEFADGDPGKAFWHQLRRRDGWRSVVIRWDREPKTEPVYDA